MGLPVRTAEKRPGVVPGGSVWGGSPMAVKWSSVASKPRSPSSDFTTAPVGRTAAAVLVGHDMHRRLRPWERQQVNCAMTGDKP